MRKEVELVSVRESHGIVGVLGGGGWSPHMLHLHEPKSPGILFKIESKAASMTVFNYLTE